MKPAGLTPFLGLLAASLGALFGLPSPAAASRAAGEEEHLGAGPDDARAQHAKARLIAEHAALVPGKTAFLGITFDIDPHWHLYWDGLSDTGMPIQVVPELPEGYTAGALLWPTPKRLILPGDLLDYIYEDRVTLILPVSVPADAKPGEKVRFAARLDWLVCKDVCLPGAAEVELTLPVADPDGPAPQRTADAGRFDETRARLPVPASESSPDLSIRWTDNSTLTLVARAATQVTFYPRSDSAALVDPIREGTAEGPSLTITVDRPTPGSGKPTVVSGVLEATFSDGRKPAYWEIRTTIP